MTGTAMFMSIISLYAFSKYFKFIIEYRIGISVMHLSSNTFYHYITIYTFTPTHISGVIMVCVCGVLLVCRFIESKLQR